MDKYTLLNYLNSTGEVLSKSDLCDSQYADVSKLINKLNQKQIIVSVFGQFKRGKSTLINSILNEQILPVGIIPVTSVVTEIVYGDKNAEVYFGEDIKEIKFEELSEYINEQNNPNNVKNVTSVRLSFPSTFLKSGITIVDTPGVGSVHKHNTDMAYSYVKKSDAVVFLLSVDSPINEIESDFLIQIKQYISKIYFAVNKIDLLNEKELSDYLNYCKKIICDLINTCSVTIFPISAKESDLGTKQLIDSIMTEIKSEGEDILGESVKTKLIEIIMESLALIKLKQTALQMPIKQFEEALFQMEKRIADLDEMSKEIMYLMNQKTDLLVEKIKKQLTNRKDSITSHILTSLQEIYNNNKTIRTKELENSFKQFISDDVKDELKQLNEFGNELLKEGYENITKSYEEKLLEIHSFLKKIIKELFAIDYPFIHDNYALSERSDFYVNVNQSASYYLLNINDLIFLLPNSKANQIIYNRYEEKLREDVLRNITNMVSDYAYKLRESQRTFNSQFSSKVKVLSNNFIKFMQQTVKQRNEIKHNQTNLVEILQTQIVELEKLFYIINK
jgi:small GTP-binding protein